MKKTCVFEFLIMSFFSISPQHVGRSLPYIINGVNSEGL